MHSPRVPAFVLLCVVLASYPCRAVEFVGDDACDCEQGGTGNARATLVDAAVTLCTTSLDKDRNTRLEISIDKAGDKEAAYVDLGRTEKLVNGSSKLIDVPKKGHTLRRSEIPGSSLQVRITPLGHDSWRFKSKVLLTFSDGTTYQKCFGENALDRDARTGRFPLD